MNKNELDEKDDFKTQLERLKTFFNVDSVESLFRKLNIKLSTYTNYYSRGKLPDKLITKLQVEHQLNSEWLFYGRGTRVIIPEPPKKYKFLGSMVKEPSSPYHSSSCMIICDAIQRRDEAGRELLIAKLLQYINELDFPLAVKEEPKGNDEEKTEKKDAKEQPKA